MVLCQQVLFTRFILRVPDVSLVAESMSTQPKSYSTMHHMLLKFQTEAPCCMHFRFFHDARPSRSAIQALYVASLLKRGSASDSFTSLVTLYCLSCTPATSMGSVMSGSGQSTLSVICKPWDFKYSAVEELIAPQIKGDVSTQYHSSHIND